MSDTVTKPDDAEITRVWTLACRLNRPSIAYRSALEPIPCGPGLGPRLAGLMVQRLEACGVTEADLDRLGL